MQIPKITYSLKFKTNYHISTVVFTKFFISVKIQFRVDVADA